MLRLPPVMEEFMRQVYFTGASATGGIVLRGAFIGTLIIAYVIEVLNADAALAVKMLLWVVLREVGPLIAAVLVIQRSGTAVATELALREISGEIASLRRMRIDPYDYLVVPRVHAHGAVERRAHALRAADRGRRRHGALARSSSACRSTRCSPTSSCWRARSTWSTRSSRACCSAARSRWSPATTACIPGGHSINAVPRAAIRAVTEALLLVMLLNVVFAYVVYGIAFFGLVTAEQ